MEDDDEPPGVPEWVVTYGDMMSLLLTFFIMLVSLSEIQDEQRYRDVLDSLHDRLGYAGAPRVPPGEEPPGEDRPPEVRKFAGAAVPRDAGAGGTPRPTSPGPRSLLTRERPVRPVRTGPAAAFEAGSAAVPDGAGAALDALAEILRGKAQKVELRGFAPPAKQDGAPADAADLAHRRARAVLAELTARGVRPGRFRLRTGGPRSAAPADEPPDRVEVWTLDVLATDPRLR